MNPTIKILIKIFCIVAILMGVVLFVRGATNVNGFGELVLGVLMIVGYITLYVMVHKHK